MSDDYKNQILAEECRKEFEEKLAKLGFKQRYINEWKWFIMGIGFGGILCLILVYFSIY